MGRCGALAAVTALCAAFCATLAGADEVSDAYLRGYVAGLLDAGGAPHDSLRGVRDGVVFVSDTGLEPAAREALLRKLSAVDGVGEVRWLARDEDPASETTFLPDRPLFAPPVADPRWPRFSVTYSSTSSDSLDTHVGTATFGGHFPVLQSDLPGEGRWDVGVQAGVYALFDLDAPSQDLLNADYFVALPFGARWNELAFTVRLFHDSSHLGDEYLLNGGEPIDRISYEGVDSLIGYDLFGWGRAYAGGGYLLHVSPGGLAPGYAQAGFELISPRRFLWDMLRPLAALDVQWRAFQDWRAAYSLRAGVRIEGARLLAGRRVYLLGEYFRGASPAGQIVGIDTRSLGVGLHLEF